MDKIRALLLLFFKLIVRSGVKGSWRVADILAKYFKSLQLVPIEVDGGVLFGDMRIGSARGILASPISVSGEEKVMAQFVRPGDTVFDIVAHFGFYTLLLSKLVGASGIVFAFEPNPELLPCLRRTVEVHDNISLFETALSEKRGEIELFVPEDASMASLSNWTNSIAGKVHSVMCDMKVLDELIDAGEIPLPNFIKCDVEGAELSVFAGAHTIFDSVNAPVVLFELNKKALESFGNKTSDYRRFFESRESATYTLFEVFPGGIRDMQDWDVAYTNVLAVPASRQW